MSLSKSASLVQKAESQLGSVMLESLDSVYSGENRHLTTAADQALAYKHWAKALNDVNLHITVRPEEIEEAVEAYHQVANILVDKLHWPHSSIAVLPQGSASTQTLIRSPIGNEKFDIDAICQVDISQVDASDPMGFFQLIGEALEELEADAKKRCWNIPFPRKPFYLEFTPSVPLASVLTEDDIPIFRSYQAAPHYQATALAVVDTPTRLWKASNPKGMSTWVDDTAKLRLIFDVAMEAYDSVERANIAPVPSQEVHISDTLRVAIRLFKRHRDMSVRRGIIDSGVKPISIIIVTLLTRCYEGLAELNRGFNHPVEVLDRLAELLPNLIDEDENGYRVDNPTVDGENFAEKWNHDGGARYQAWHAWCEILRADLKRILAAEKPEEISKIACDVFGIPLPTNDGSGLKPNEYKVPPPVRPGRGLA